MSQPGGASTIDERLAAAGLPALPRGGWLEIDLDALAGNVRAIAELVGAGVQVAPVVKSDAYGHGLEQSARAFVEAGAARLCVASLEEALRLRAAGIGAPIVVLFMVPPAAVGEAVRAGVELNAGDEAALRAVLEAWPALSRATGGELALHLEIETGLGRSGVLPARAAAAAAAIARAPRTRLAGVWSHLASSEDQAASAAQVAAFESALEGIRGAGVDVPIRHLAASGGIFGGSAPAYEMVRPGLAAYGLLPEELTVADGARAAAARLRPALALKARPLRIEELPAGAGVGYGSRWRAAQPTRVATLPLGYGDGYAKAYWPGGEALVRGRRVPIVGVVMMDVVVVDVSAIPDLTLYDEFVLLGRQGEHEISANDLAHARTTISWEVLTSMAQRIPRVYHRAAVPMAVRTLTGEVLPERTS
ncbi:MAG TPA: alanine racemase [Candidatus Limnocylindrales bacterium]